MHYMKNPTKSCESDVIPTTLLKEILLVLAPSLAKILKHLPAAWHFCIMLESSNHQTIVKKSRTGPDL